MSAERPEALPVGNDNRRSTIVTSCAGRSSCRLLSERLVVVPLAGTRLPSGASYEQPIILRPFHGRIAWRVSPSLRWAHPRRRSTANGCWKHLRRTNCFSLTGHQTPFVPAVADASCTQLGTWKVVLSVGPLWAIWVKANPPAGACNHYRPGVAVNIIYSSPALPVHKPKGIVRSPCALGSRRRLAALELTPPNGLSDIANGRCILNTTSGQLLPTLRWGGRWS